MQKNLINISAFTFIIAGLTACGGGSGGSKTSSTPANSSVAAMSSVAASSVAPASSSSVSSIDPSAENTTLLGTVSNTIPTKGISTGSNNIEIAEINNCGSGISSPANSFSLFADYDVTTQNQTLSNISEWNWIDATATWDNVANTPAAYNFPSTTTVNTSCNSAETFSTILVKKIADWTNQHATGFKSETILTEGITFGDIKSLTVDLKINSANTTIPTIASLKTTYAPTYVTAEKIDALENGKVNLDITFYQKNESLDDYRAKVIFEIDQTTMSNKWLRVTIPASAIYYYLENNYNRTDKTQVDLASVVIKGAIVVAETKRGNTLRNDITTWSSSTPETFKEVDVTFKKIELNLE